MAYGGGFLGGLSEFAGGLAQGIQTQKKMQAEEEELKMRKAEHQARMDELNRTAEIRKTMGGVAGYTVKEGATGVLSDEAYQALGAEAPATKGGEQPAPKAGAMPIPEPQVAPQQAQAPVTAAPAIPTPEVSAREAAPAPVVGIPSAQGTQAAETPAQTAQVAAQPSRQPAKGDYVRARLADGSVGWVPKNEAQMRDAAEVTREMSEAIRGLDPEMSQRMLANSYDLETKNIALTSARYGDAVMKAARTFQANPEEGVKMLQGAWSLMPDMTDAEIKQGKDGNITVQRFITKGDKKIPVENAQSYKPEDLFRFAISLSNPDSMRQYAVDQAAFAAQTFSQTMQQAELKLRQDQFAYQKERDKVDFGLRAAAARRGQGSGDGYGTPSPMTLYQTNEFGESVPAGQIITRKGKGGRIEELSTAWGQYMPYGYNWEKLYQDMSNEGRKLNLQVGIDSQTGLPAYKGSRAGKIRPISANTLEQYRRK